MASNFAVCTMPPIAEGMLDFLKENPEVQELVRSLLADPHKLVWYLNNREKYHSKARHDLASAEKRLLAMEAKCSYAVDGQDKVIAALQGELDALKEQHEHELAAAAQHQEAAEAEMFELEFYLDQSSAQVEDLKRSLEEQDVQIGVLNKENAQLQAALTASRAKLPPWAPSHVTPAPWPTLPAQNKRITVLTAENQQLIQQLADLQQQFDVLQGQAVQVEEEHDELVALRFELTVIKSTLRTEQQEKQQLMMELHQGNTMQQQLHQQVQELQRHLHEARLTAMETAGSLEQACSDLQQQLESARAHTCRQQQLDESRLAAAQQQVEVIKALEDDLQQQSYVLQGKTDQLEEEYDELVGLKHALSVLKRRVGAIRKERQQGMEAQQLLQGQLQELQCQLHDLQQERQQRAATDPVTAVQLALGPVSMSRSSSDSCSQPACPATPELASASASASSSKFSSRRASADVTCY